MVLLNLELIEDFFFFFFFGNLRLLDALDALSVFWAFLLNS